MTAKPRARGMTFQLQSVAGERQALATLLTETQGQALALPSLLAPETDLKVCYACCVSIMHLTTVTQLIIYTVCPMHADTVTVPNRWRSVEGSACLNVHRGAPFAICVFDLP